MTTPLWRAGLSGPPAAVSSRSPTYSDLFLGDFLLRVETSNFAEAGAWIELLITISFALMPFPYSLALPSLSGRRVEPSREIPANSPREREYERTSARMVISVEAAAFR